MNGSSLTYKPRGCLPVPLGECVGRGVAGGEGHSLPALRQVGLCCVCAQCSPDIPQTSSHSAFHGFSESTLCTKVWVCFHPKAKKEIPHRKCLCTLISTLQSVWTQWRNSTELNTPLQSGTSQESPPSKNFQESLCPCESPKRHLSKERLLFWGPRVVFLSIYVQALNLGPALDTAQGISRLQKPSKQSHSLQRWNAVVYTKSVWEAKGN